MTTRQVTVHIHPVMPAEAESRLLALLAIGLHRALGAGVDFGREVRVYPDVPDDNTRTEASRW